MTTPQNTMVEEKVSIVKREVRFVTHIPRTEFNDDCHYVKEQITLSDGRQIPKAYLVKDYLRPVWVTSQSSRNHNEKKEFELIENLNVAECTESDVDSTYASKLGQAWLANNSKRLNESPYVYGKNLNGTNFIKLASLQRNNFIQTPYTVAALDLETDMDTNEILVGSITMFRDGKIHIYCASNTKWTKGIDDVVGKTAREIDNWLPEYKGKIVLTHHEYDDEIDIIADIFKAANEWAPDFLDVWNIEFDIADIILPALRKRGIDPIDILCDQRVERAYRRFDFIRGANKKKMASGKEDSIPPADRWHKIFATCTFQLIDGMCVYRSLRIHEGKDPSYALDPVLDKELKSSKLVVPGTEHMSVADWHRHMQKKRKIIYIIYNFVDNIRLLELDLKTTDLSVQLPTFAEITNFNDFKSSEARSYCSLFIYGLSINRIIGTGANMSKVQDHLAQEENEDGELNIYQFEPLGIKDWIQTLPQGNVVRKGLAIFFDYPLLITNARGNVVDLDSVSSYPSCVMAANVSKETCRTELIEIKNIPESVFRMQNLGVVVNKANSIEYCERMLGAPGVDDVLHRLRSGKYDHLKQRIAERKKLKQD